MAKVSLVARTGKGRIRNTAARPSVGQAAFRAAFPDARTVGLVPGDAQDPLSLLQVAHVLDAALRSTGGRPALNDAEDTPLRVALLRSDRQKLEALRARLSSGARLRPSAAQLVAVLCHLALTRIPEEELSAATRDSIVKP